MLETIAAAYSGFIGSISNYLYTYILIVLLVAGGIYFTVRTKFVQFRFLPESIRIVMQPSEDQNSISAFKTLMVSTASRVGTGNIAGISTAICLGGTGAVFWMWVTALLGSATAFVEGTLAQIYKKRAKDGSCYGGPAYYIEQALKQRWLGVLFAVVMILTYMVGFNLVASFNIADSLKAYSFYDPTLTPWIVGIVLAVVFLVCISGGGKQIANITAVLVPVMGVLYLAVTLFVVFTHISLIPAVFASIFRNAFNFQAIFGGFVGSALMQGIKRGLFSNEAGIGAAACAAGSAGVSHPAKQGLVQVLSVFIDTIVVCTATAMLLLCSGVDRGGRRHALRAAGHGRNSGSVRRNFHHRGPVPLRLHHPAGQLLLCRDRPVLPLQPGSLPHRRVRPAGHRHRGGVPGRHHAAHRGLGYRRRAHGSDGSHQCACHRPAPQARPALPRRLHSAKEVRQESGVQGLFHRPEGKGGFLELNSSSSFLKGALLRERSRFLCSCRTAMKLHLHFTPLCRTDLHCFVTLVLV